MSGLWTAMQLSLSLSPIRIRRRSGRAEGADERVRFELGDSPFLSRVRIEPGSRENHLHRQRLSHYFRQPLGAPGPRNGAQLNLGLAEDGILASDDDVAPERGQSHDWREGGIGSSANDENSSFRRQQSESLSESFHGRRESVGIHSHHCEFAPAAEGEPVHSRHDGLAGIGHGVPRRQHGFLVNLVLPFWTGRWTRASWKGARGSGVSKMKGFLGPIRRSKSWPIRRRGPLPRQNSCPSFP